MKKGICIGTLPGGISDEGFALAKEAGFDGVEVGTLNDEASRKKAADLAKKHGLAIPSVMNAAHWAKPLSDPDPKVRRESVEGMLASLLLCDRLFRRGEYRHLRLFASLD